MAPLELDDLLGAELLDALWCQPEQVSEHLLRVLSQCGRGARSQRLTAAVPHGRACNVVRDQSLIMVVEGAGGYKMGKLGFETICAPPPPKTIKKTRQHG